MTRQLGKDFARKMAPLALLAGLVLAAAPPLSYAVIAWMRLEANAALDAEAVAARVRPAVERNPLLWRYNTPKLTQAVGLSDRSDDRAAIRVVGCDGLPVLSPTRQKGATAGPTGRAPIRVRGETAGFVEVQMDSREERAALVAVAGGSGLLGLTVGLLLFLYPTRVVRRQAGRLSESLTRLGAAEERLTEANRVLEARVAAAVAESRALSERVLGIQEEERGRIARDLHDSVGQALTALQIELSLAKQQGGAARPHVEEAMRTCEATLAEIRRVVRDLRPLELERDDLVEALRSVAERFEVRTRIATSFRVEAGEVPSDAVKLCLLRVLQEALTNVSRHAGASEVGVELTVRPDEVLLRVSDDGRGFDAAARPDGSGLSGIRQRCAFLSGEAAIETGPEAGTTLSIRLPNRAA